MAAMNPLALLAGQTGQFPASSPPQPNAQPAQYEAPEQYEAESPEADVYEFPADELGHPVRIRIDGSSRMMSRQTLQQIVPMLFQILMNGPLLAQLNATGYNIDVLEMMRLLQDAAGTTRSYEIIRPLNQQEQQRLAQPPPQAGVDMQKAQLEAQTRIKMGELKAQTEKAKLDVESRLRELEIEEESARALIKTIQDERAQLATADVARQKAEVETRSRAAKSQMELAHLSQKNRLDQESAQAKHRATMTQTMAQVMSTLANARAQAEASRITPSAPGRGAGRTRSNEPEEPNL